MTEKELKAIEDCQSGQSGSFGVLYDLYIKKIYDFIYYKTHHKETAEDLTSLAFTKALENIKKYDAGVGSFSSWLYRIARNTVIDHYRAQKFTRDIADVWDLATNEDIARDTDTRAKLAEVETYLKRLSTEQRDIIIMRVWQEMSHQEIAAALGKTESSVKMAYSRAMRELRKDIPALAALLTVILSEMYS